MTSSDRGYNYSHDNITSYTWPFLHPYFLIEP